LRRAVVALAACVLTACAGGGNGGGGSTGPTGCVCKAPGCPTVSFAQNIQPIFNRSCATSGLCHVGNGAGDLDLTSSVAYKMIVRVKSSQQPNKLRVKPGSPDASYLYQKITGAPGISGLLMPQGCPGAPLQGQCLTGDEIGAIAQWITECAQQN
jgi:hypothetical protein